MKKLVIIRHGDYDANGHLSEEGIDQITALAQLLKKEVAGRSVLILSSIADRASESATIIADTLGISFESHRLLWSEKRRPVDFPALLRLIRERENEVEFIVLVTHREYCEDFPLFFRSSMKGKPLEKQFRFPVLAKGEGAMIDCESAEVVRLLVSRADEANS